MSEFTVDLATQEVIVKGSLPYEDVLARIKKTGKEVRSMGLGRTSLIELTG